MITNPRRFPNNGQGDGANRPSARAVTTELYTLGGVRVTQQGAPLDVDLGSKHLALLIYLFHERRPMHPLEVVELLGHGQSYDRELDGLRRTVKWLNQSVPFVNIRETSETIEGVGGVWLDTMDVEAAIDARKPVRVAKLYVGEFLEGFESGVQAFDEWAKKERGRLKRAWEHAMTRAAREASEDRKWRTAAEWWRIAVARAPMRSEPVAHLLEAYARTGRHEEAKQAYSDYSERLRRSGVSDVPGVIKQVIARFPMLQRIAAKPSPSSTEERPLAREMLRSERQQPAWDLEPAPAPPDAFDLTFELPEVEIPKRPGPLTSASPAGRPVPNADSSLVAPTHSFHALDEPVRPEFALGVAREAARGLADELLVETVAMAFEKITADSLDPDPADRNSGAEAGDGPCDDEAESTGRPEGFDDNSIHDLRDGNGAPPARSETPEKYQPKPSPKPPEARGAKGEESRGGDAREPNLADSPPGKFRGPPRDKGDRDRDRDLYRATAAILAAFVEDGDDASGERDGQRLTGFGPGAKAGFAERPVADSPDPWADFGGEPSEEGVAESRPVADAELESTPPIEPADFRWEAPSQGPALPWEGRAAPFEDSDPAGFDIADLSLDESDPYGGQFTRVRHHVTSVRKPWGPVLRDAWAGVSGWFAESFGGLWERLRRSRVNGQRIDLEERPEVADYFEPLASTEPTGEPAYTTPVQDASEHVEREAPTGLSADQAPASSRYGLQADGSEEAWGRSDPALDEEAPVEWYEEWQTAPTDASVDEAYEAEGDLYAPAAERESIERVAAARVASLLRRHWYAPVGAIILAAALSFGPKVIGLFGEDAGETAVAEEPSAQEPSLPKITVRAPAFVQTSISKINQLFSGAILEAPGEWVVVADLQSSVIDEVGLAGSEEPSVGAGATDLTPAALTLALEADRKSVV